MLPLESSSKRPKVSSSAVSSSSSPRLEVSLKEVTQLPDDIQRRILPPERLTRDILELRRPESRSEEAGKQLTRFRFLEKHLPVIGNDWKNTFLRAGIRTNHPSFFNLLFKQTENPDMPTLLRTAVQSRNDVAFKALLNRTPVPLSPESLNETMECLALYGQPEKLEQLLQRQPEAHRPSADEIEDLFNLAQTQQQKIRRFAQLSPEEAKRQLFWGIELNVQSQLRYPLHLVALLQNPNLDVNALTRYEEDDEEVEETPLQRAIRFNDKPAFQVLLAEPRVSVTEPVSDTPLHTAAIIGRADMLKVLLNRPELEGLVNIRNAEQETPLHLAIWHDSAEAVKVLQERPELDVNVQDRDGDTPLHIAALLGYLELMQLLMKNAPKLDVNARNHNGETPLHRAVRANKVGAVKALLKAPQLKINVRDEDGLTPLGIASVGNDPTILELLRQHGATE